MRTRQGVQGVGRRSGRRGLRSGMTRLYNRRLLLDARRHLRTHGTPAEAALWRLLQRRRLGGRKFRRQFSVGPYVLDFYCPAERLAVELDGAAHDAPAQRAYDEARTRWLGTADIRMLRFENRAVFEAPEAVCAAIAACFQAG